MKKIFQREQGQTMAEYALVLGVITAAIVLAIGDLSTAIAGSVSRVAALL